MSLSAALEALIESLAPDQREAATADAGPVLCVAPAGSGKTTTLVARIAWRIAAGVDPATVAAITFNRRAAEELRSRIEPVLTSIGVDPASVAVRTFHALGREILRDGGQPIAPLIDRDVQLRTTFPDLSSGALRRLDDHFSRLKLDSMVTAADVAADPDPGPVGLAFIAYERALSDAGALDFDDLVAGALRILRSDGALLERWRQRCAELFVDEVQDVDRSQLELAFELSEPAHRLFLVGDDDQTIYGWRLADVRRILGLAARLPNLRRIDLVTNRRCPAVVVDRAARLVAHNRERFAKEIRATPSSIGRLVLAADGGDDVERVMNVLAAWKGHAGSRAFLARTNRELLPAMAVLVEEGVAFRAAAHSTDLDNPCVDRLLEAVTQTTVGLPLLVRLHRAREILTAAPDRLTEGEREAIAAVIGWASRYADVAGFSAAIARTRCRLVELMRDDADLTLATAHSTKGLEFDHVAVLGMDAGRFPSGRSVAEASDPGRALEEERRLAYVAWTRARRTLTLVYDPAAPSSFLLEAFSADELGLSEAA